MGFEINGVDRTRGTHFDGVSASSDPNQRSRDIAARLRELIRKSSPSPNDLKEIEKLMKDIRTLSQDPNLSESSKNSLKAMLLFFDLVLGVPPKDLTVGLLVQIRSYPTVGGVNFNNVINHAINPAQNPALDNSQKNLMDLVALLFSRTGGALNDKVRQLNTMIRSLRGITNNLAAFTDIIKKIGTIDQGEINNILRPDLTRRPLQIPLWIRGKIMEEFARHGIPNPSEDQIANWIRDAHHTMYFEIATEFINIRLSERTTVTRADLVAMLNLRDNLREQLRLRPNPEIENMLRELDKYFPEGRPERPPSGRWEDLPNPPGAAMEHLRRLVVDASKPNSPLSIASDALKRSTEALSEEANHDLNMQMRMVEMFNSMCNTIREAVTKINERMAQGSRG